MNILIVEDDPNQIERIERLLQNDHTIFSAISAEDAKGILTTEQVDLASIDVVLPGKDGISLKNELAVEFPNTKVIMVTGREIEKVANLRRIDKGFEFIAKPWKAEELIAVVNQSLKKQNPTKRNLRILLVDDEPDLVFLLEITLGEYHQIEGVTDANIALERIDKNAYDLVLSDIRMPHMDGVEFLKKIRENHKSLPFIAVSGHLLEKTKEYDQLTDFGFLGAIMKPFASSISILSQIDHLMAKA